MRYAFAIVLLYSVLICQAQIKTSEVSVEAIGDVTQIQGKTAVAMSTDPNFNLTVGANLNNTYTSTPDIASRGIMTHGIGTAPGNLYLHRDDVTISSGDILGALRFSGADGGEQIGAEIRGVSSGSWNPGSSAGDLVFLTNPTGVTEPVERMRINRYGNIGIGDTNPSMKLQVHGSVGTGFNNVFGLDYNEWYNLGNVSGYGFINWFSKANASNDNFVNTHSSVKGSSIRGGNGEIKFLTSAVNNGVGQPSLMTERMSIEYNGNIGIGTSNPGNWFAGKVLEFADSRPTFKINASGSLGTLMFTNNGVNSSSHIGEFHVNHNFNSADHAKSQLQFGSYPGGNVMVVQSDGNVGIGTSSPASTLDVEGVIQSDYLRLDAANASEGGELNLKGPSGSNDWIIDNYIGKFRLHHSGQTYFQISPTGSINTGSNSQISFGKVLGSSAGEGGEFIIEGDGFNQWNVDNYRGNYRLFHSGLVFFQIDPNGNVGIGTSSPTEKLHVNGKIRATGQVGWSDFVFYDDYELPTLAEVEQHIQEKGHLKDIPSEKEVLEEGIDLTEMDSKLLQKIEELTLYLIEQNKKIDHLMEENGQLKTSIEALEQP